MTDAAVEYELGEETRIIVRAMLTTSSATDLWLGDLTRRGYATSTLKTYRWILDKFVDGLPDSYTDVSEVTIDDCRRYLDRLNNKAAGTRAHAYSVLSSFFGWLTHTERIKRSPLEKLERPKRIASEDLDVTTVSTEGVRKLLAEAKTWTERLAVAVPAYTGARRKAIAQLRLEDYDRDRGLLRFREKGGKVIWKPVPIMLAELIAQAIAEGAITEPLDYLVPHAGPTPAGRQGPRDDRVIWKAVKDVGERAGVTVHVHALRAAFAVHFLEVNSGNIEALKDLMGHSSLATTQVYLRKRDRAAGMEAVRTLNWATPETPQTAGKRFEEPTLVEAGGFEPPSPEPSVYDTLKSNIPAGQESELADRAKTVGA